MNFINSLKGKYPVIFLGKNGQIRRQNVAFSELSFFVLPDDKTLRRASAATSLTLRITAHGQSDRATPKYDKSKFFGMALAQCLH